MKNWLGTLIAVAGLWVGLFIAAQTHPAFGVLIASISGFSGGVIEAGLLP